MNLLRKARLVAFVLAGVAITMISCKPKDDLYGPMESLSDNNIAGTYSYVLADTVNFVTTVYEYDLIEAADGVRTGTYVVETYTGATGTLALSDTTHFTWERGSFTEDHLAITLKLTFTDGTVKDVKWGSKSITDDQYTHASGPHVVILKTIVENLPNHDWQFADSTFFLDTTYRKIDYYLFEATVGNRKNGGRLNQEQVDSINNFISSPEGQAAIAWYKDSLLIFNPNATLSEWTIAGEDTVRLGDPVYNYVADEQGYRNVVYFGWKKDSMTVPVIKRLGIKEATTAICHLNSSTGVSNNGTYEFHYVANEDVNTTEPKLDNKVYSIENWIVGSTGTTLTNKTFTVYAKVKGQDALLVMPVTKFDKKSFTLFSYAFVSRDAE